MNNKPEDAQSVIYIVHSLYEVSNARKILKIVTGYMFAFTTIIHKLDGYF